MPGGVHPRGGTDVADGVVELRLVPAVQDQGGAVGGEPVREGQAQAVGGAGDEDCWLVGHVTIIGSAAGAGR